jgi:hypothetical protein
MSRIKVSLLSGFVVLAGVGAASPAASAQPPDNASCLGVLSSFAGQAGIRSEFAPAPGRNVSQLAQEHGDFAYCFAVFSGQGG